MAVARDRFRKLRIVGNYHSEMQYFRVLSPAEYRPTGSYSWEPCLRIQQRAEEL